MRQNYKFHAIAIAVICILITAMFFLFGPKEQAPVDNTLHGDRYVEIYSATWGRECNEYIKQAIIDRNKVSLNKTAEKDANGNPVQQPMPVLATHDNVLDAVNRTCNGKLACDVTANSDALGLEPLASCLKKLEVSYRCFAYDRLQQVTISQGSTQKIDCAPTDASAPATSAPAAPAN